MSICCRCGDYGCTLILVPPPILGLRRYVPVDGCLAGEIWWLWRNGIRTEASCCGHDGRVPAGIAVADDQVEAMLRLGYQQIGEAPPAFRPRSLPPHVVIVDGVPRQWRKGGST